MKKLFILLAAITLVTMQSCKKDWTCGCHTTDYSTGDVVYYNVEIPNETKDRAQERCASGSNGGTGGTFYTSCSLLER